MSARDQRAGKAADHTSQGGETTPAVWKGAVAGLLGGVVGSIAIDAYLTTAAKGSTSGERALKKAQEPAGLAAAKTLEKVMGRPLPVERIPAAGMALHYLFGAGMGLAYGLAAEVSPGVTTGAGAAFGAGSSLVLDVVAVPALGFDEPPWETPPVLHAHALIGHVVFGVATEATRRLIRRLLG